MLAQGNAAGAETIYQKMYAATNPKFVRIAALRGQAMAQKEKAVGMLASLLADADADLAGAAARFLMELPGPAATASIAATVAGAPAGVQVRLIDILVERGDKAASAPVMALVAAEDAAVRTAAIRALGVLGDASAVPALAKAVSAGGDDAKAATNSLNQLKGEGVGEAMATLLSSPDAAIRTGILGVMTARGDKSMAPAMVKAARDADPGIRSAGISGLAAVGGQEQLADIADLLVSTKDEADRGNVERALVASVARCDDADAAATPLAAAMTRADDDAKSRLLTALAQAGGAKALAAVRDQVKSSSEPVATQAVRSLAAWPDSAPADDLLAVMKTSANRTHKALAFRGYVRMANMAGVRPAAETTKMIQQALALATTSAEKKAVLAGLAGARSAEALKMVESLLSDAELKAEAEAALLQVAGNCRDVAPAEARAALEKIVATTQNDAIKGQAQGVLNDMNKYAGFISTWMGAGPYTEGNLFDTAYPPEKGDKTVKWKVLDKGVGPQIIDLLQAVSGGDNRAAYVRTYLYSPEARDAQFQMGSDDGIRAWVNGQQVHSNNATRPCKPGEDKAKAPLKQGWNEVLVKVTQGGADWSFSFRVCKSDGQPMTDVKVALEPQ
jgi:HEAT repeat protein